MSDEASIHGRGRFPRDDFSVLRISLKSIRRRSIWAPGRDEYGHALSARYSFSGEVNAPLFPPMYVNDRLYENEITYRIVPIYSLDGGDEAQPFAPDGPLDSGLMMKAGKLHFNFAIDPDRLARLWGELISRPNANVSIQFGMVVHQRGDAPSHHRSSAVFDRITDIVFVVDDHLPPNGL